jgi:ubiquinone biosynthesis protein UbiJ
MPIQPHSSVNSSFPHFPEWATKVTRPFLAPSWLPAGAAAELRNRFLLLVNHVLRAEPAAPERLRPHAGHTVHIQFGEAHLSLRITRAGLLESADEALPAEQAAGPGLRLTAYWPAVAQPGMHAPAWRVEGDSAMAASFAWLSEHLRWDVEADLARWVGPVVAGQATRLARPVAKALSHMLRQRS